MRYQFIDKILKLEINKEIVIIKNVTITEDYFADHFPGFPVLPGALQIEAMAQACGALTEISSDYKLFSILLMVDKMKFKTMIHPGDQMIISATAVSLHEDSAMFTTKIEVGGKVVTSGKIMTGLISINEQSGKYKKAINGLKDYFEFLLRDAEVEK